MSLPTRVGQSLLRLNWFAVIPALLAALWLRHALPAPFATGPRILLSLAELTLRHPVPAFVLAFLIFAGLLRYWRFYLPWGYCLAHLSPSFAAGTPRAALGEMESAARLRRVVARREADAMALARFDEAFAARDLHALRAARAELERSAGPMLRTRARVEMVSFLAALGAAAVVALLLREHWFQNYSVLSSSMLPTLERGDQLTADHRAYLPKNGVSSLPQRGDIVIFHHAGDQDVVKRVIGLPGDEIRMRGGSPIINGWEVPHCSAGRYVYWGGGVSVDGQLFVEFLEQKTYLTVIVPPARPFQAYSVKPGEVFVLGDNRNLSLDSRTWRDGQPSGLPTAAIAGRVERIALSPKRNGELDFSSMMAKVDDLHLNSDGLNTVELQRQVQACLAKRPSKTSPPAALATRQLSQAGSRP